MDTGKCTRNYVRCDTHLQFVLNCFHRYSETSSIKGTRATWNTVCIHLYLAVRFLIHVTYNNTILLIRQKSIKSIVRRITSFVDVVYCLVFHKDISVGREVDLFPKWFCFLIIGGKVHISGNSMGSVTSSTLCDAFIPVQCFLKIYRLEI